MVPSKQARTGELWIRSVPVRGLGKVEV